MATTRVSGFWQSRPTLVTGAAGLVGAWVVRQLLAESAQVVCLVRDCIPQSRSLLADVLEQVTMVGGDVCDQALLERVLGEYEITVVLHLAAQAIVGVANANPISTFETNIGGTWALLEACRRSPKVAQIVVASSDKAYGEADRLPYDETMPLAGKHPYDVSKSCADLLAQSYASTYGLPVAITRCGNFYGPGDLHWNRIVPGTIRSVFLGERPIIRSDGMYVRDYLYVGDGASSYLTLAEKLAANPALRGQAFNFSTEAGVTVLDLVRKITGLMGSSLEPEIRNEARHEIAQQTLSAQKARRELGWKPHFTLDQGLRATIPWYLELLNRQQTSSRTNWMIAAPLN